MRKIILALIFVLSLIMITQAQSFPTLPECPVANGLMCWMPNTITIDELPELETNEHAFISDDDRLTFVYRREDDFEQAMVLFWNGMLIPLEPIGEAGYQVATIGLENAERAVLTFGLADVDATNTLRYQQYGFPYTHFWGEDAPQPIESAGNLAGRLIWAALGEATLGTKRDVIAYLPPDHDPRQTYPVLYMTDGELLRQFVIGLDALVVSGEIPPLLVVGSYNAGQTRGLEYVIGRDAAIFEAHETFFTQELRLWAESELGASTERDLRGIAGISNGGVFVMAMLARHPELYRFAMPLSIGASADEPYASQFTISTETIQQPLRVYLSAGTLEPLFLDTTRFYAQQLEASGAVVEMVENVSAHDATIWTIEFTRGLRWLFNVEAGESLIGGR